MLVVGMGNLSLTESKAHLSLWSLLAAPLWVGADVTKLDPAAMAVLLNHEVIAIDQDVLAIMAKRVPLSKSSREVLATTADSSCNAASFLHPFKGIQCQGFSPLPNASTPAACEAALRASGASQWGLAQQSVSGWQGKSQRPD